MDFVYLIELVVPWEERKHAKQLKEYATVAPHVHLEAVVTIRE